MRIVPIALAIVVGACFANADWPQYLGPNRNAIVEGGNIARTWPEGGPKKLWAFPLGPGHGGMSIHAGEVFVLDRVLDEGDILRCVDLETGKRRWSFAYDAPGMHSHPGSRSIPTVDAEFVWAVGPFGHFHCISRMTHTPVWKTHLLENFDAREPQWGVSQSPLLYGDLVVVAPQGRKGGVVAFDKKTGELRWASRELLGTPCYVSPSIVSLDGMDQIIMISASDQYDDSVVGEVVALDPANGKVVWEYRGFHTYVNIAPPVIVGENRLFFTNGSNGAQFDPIALLVEVKRQGVDFEVTEVFRTNEAAGKMHPPILHEDYLYFNDIRKPNRMTCLSLDGQVMWNEAPDFQLGAFIMVDGLILNQDGKTGDLHLIEPSPKGYKELAQAKLFPEKKGEPWAPLAFSDGRLVIRDGEQMVCVELR